jgi:hypothetical protein
MSIASSLKSGGVRVSRQRFLVDGQQRLPKVVAEVEMGVAANILLSSSSVIIVGEVFCLASVELYGRNSTKGNIAMLLLSQGMYPAGEGIHPKHREIPIELETVVRRFTILAVHFFVVDEKNLQQLEEIIVDFFHLESRGMQLKT